MRGWHECLWKPKEWIKKQDNHQHNILSKDLTAKYKGKDNEIPANLGNLMCSTILDPFHDTQSYCRMPGL